jgi:PEP-CTERM motif
MKLQRLVLTLVFVVAVSSLSFAALITPISASVNLLMSADAGCGPSPSTPSYEDWVTNGPVLNPLNSVAAVTASCSKPNRNVTAEGQLAATWQANTKKGAINFTNVGWTANANVTSGAANANLGSDYTYTFSPTTEILFSMNYNITPKNNNMGNFGLNGFYITLTNNWSGLYGVGSSGTLTAILLPSQTYTLTILNEANISGNIAGDKEHMNGKFNWAATAVPEPSSMLLLGSGILALAGALRKKMNG